MNLIPIFVCRKFLVAAAATLFAMPLFAAPAAPKTADLTNDVPYDIKVRSEVDKPFGGFKHTEPPDHGKVYYVIAVQEVKAPEKLVRPVDENRMLDLAEAELHKRGFRKIVKGETPQIVIIIEYGRGLLRNPYTADSSANPNSTSSGGDNDFTGGLPTVTITGAMPTQLLKQKEPGFLAKLEAAKFEKLYIRMTAYQYPKPEGKRPQIAWRTTMLTDNPDNMDLNQVAKKLLAAGGKYFDHNTDKIEAEVSSDLPEGKVDIGTPEVVRERK